MEEIAGIFLIIYLVLMVFSSVFGILSYVLSSLGMYSIADRRGIKHAWMAWLPVVNAWTLGCISDQYQQVAKGKNKRKRVALLTLQIVMYALLFIMIVALIVMMIQAMALGDTMSDESAMEMMGFLGVFYLFYFAILGVGVAYTIIYYFALYDLYVSCKPDSGVLYIVLTIVLSVTAPFLIFSCRKKDLGMYPQYQQPAYQPPMYTMPQQPVAQPGAPTWHSVQNPQYQPPMAEQPQQPSVEEQQQ